MQKTRPTNTTTVTSLPAYLQYTVVELFYKIGFVFN